LKIAQLSPDDLQQRLKRPGLCFDLHPFVVNVQSPLAAVAHGLATMYGQRSLADEHGFIDFHVRVAPPANLRRWLHPQAFFYLDQRAAFKPLPQAQAFPMLEWGLNWCVAAHAHQFLIFHAAVVEKNGRAAVLPAPPGSGKSTLCAGLVSRGGWRLLSDELALMDPRTMQLHALARPVNLKNQSIDVMRAFAPGAAFSPRVPHTAKGTVALMAPPEDSVARMRETAQPAWIVFPKFLAGADAAFGPRPKAWAAWVMAEQSFNFNLHGQAGFQALTRMVDRCTCLDFEYSQLEEALQAFDDLATGHLDDEATA
jgi:HprK-related kinase A